MPRKANHTSDGGKNSSFVSATELDKSTEYRQATLSRYQGRFRCSICGVCRYTYRGIQEHYELVRHGGVYEGQ